MKHLFLTSSIDTANVAESVYEKLRPSSSPKIALILTATEAETMIGMKTWEGEEREALNRAGFTTFDYTITGKNISQINQDLKDVDALYVSGGNEFYFREQCDNSDFEKFVHEFVESGKPYIGTSCGSIMAGTDISPTLNLNDLSCLKKPPHTTGFSLVDFSILPHWGLEDFQDEYINQSFENLYMQNRKMIAINNYEYVEVLDDKYRIVDVRREK